MWFTDRYGAEEESDITVDHFSRLLTTISSEDGDDEHRSISITDEHEWNLEFYPDGRVLFENVGPDGGEEGELRDLPRQELLTIADDFLRGDFDGLRARAWS